MAMLEITWCFTHGKQIPEWSTHCWDYNPLNKPYCQPIKATVTYREPPGAGSG